MQKNRQHLNGVAQLLLFSTLQDASGTVSPDMHRVNLDYLRCSCKGPFTKKKKP